MTGDEASERAGRTASRLDPARRAVRLVAWALALGTVATVAHALLLSAIAPALPQSAALRLGTTVIAQALVALAAVAVAGLLIELPVWTGAAAGLWTAALPVAVLGAVEGAQGVAAQLGPRAVAAVLCGVAGAAGALLHRRPRAG